MRLIKLILVVVMALPAPVWPQCPPGYYGCEEIGWPSCTPPGVARVYRGENPYGWAVYRYTCEFCVIGCSSCLTWTITVEAECNGKIVQYSGTFCCRDRACCPP
jgi:hypothetical protein